MYDRKNMPRLVFCLHALAIYLAKLGMAPPMRRMDGGQRGKRKKMHSTYKKKSLKRTKVTLLLIKMF